MGALVEPMEALIISAQGEAGQVTASASEDRLIKGLAATAAEAGRVEGNVSVVAGEVPRD